MSGERLDRLARWITSSASAALVVLSMTFVACGGGQAVQQPPPPSVQFMVEAVPQTPLMTPGSSFSTTIIAIPLLGSTWNGVIAVTMSGLPSGLTAAPDSFSVDTTKSNGNVPVMFTASGSVPTGVYPFTVTGTSGSMSASVTMAIGVAEPPPAATPLQANVLYSFNGGQDGGNPAAALISDSASNLYGTTYQGGAYGPGTVFELSFLNGAWQETVLHSFGNGTDGASPLGSVVFDASGNLYGVTRSGGTSGNGTVYELTATGSGWQETVLHSFAGGADGLNPGAGLTIDQAGNLYGTTEYGGAVGSPNCAAIGCGTVFTLTPSGGGWAYSVIYAFQGADGADPGGTHQPGGEMVVDQQGNLYGATAFGGNLNCPEGNLYSHGGGCGIVFKMTKSGGAWQQSVLYSFPATYDGLRPSGLLLDPTGKLYGTTYGGFSDLQCDACGNFFELTPAGSTWTLTQLYYFWGGNFGYSPSGLVRDQAGNFYGVAFGGPPGCETGCGTVFQLSQTGQGWIENAVYDFPGGNAGWVPWGVTVVGGKLYGTTAQGGPSNYGVIFEISP